MKRILVPALALLLLGCVAEEGKPGAPPPDLGTRKAGSDWPCFLGPTGNSVSSEKGIVTPWPAAGPRLLWHKKLGQSYGAPSISRGRLFIFDRQRNQARLQAWKSETGDFLWVFEYPTAYQDLYGYNNGPRCCPVVDDDRVYIYGAEGMLHCLRAEDGKLLWKVDTAAEFGVIQNFFGVGSTPVVEGDLLLVMVGGSPEGSKGVDFGDLKGNGSGLVAFDKLTGKVRYKVTDQLASYASPVARHHRQAALVLSLRPRRPGRPRPGHRQGRFRLSLEGEKLWKASTPAAPWSSATRC